MPHPEMSKMCHNPICPPSIRPHLPAPYSVFEHSAKWKTRERKRNEIGECESKAKRGKVDAFRAAIWHVFLGGSSSWCDAPTVWYFYWLSSEWSRAMDSCGSAARILTAVSSKAKVDNYRTGADLWDSRTTFVMLIPIMPPLGKASKPPRAQKNSEKTVELECITYSNPCHNLKEFSLSAIRDSLPCDRPFFLISVKRKDEKIGEEHAGRSAGLNMEKPNVPRVFLLSKLTWTALRCFSLFRHDQWNLELRFWQYPRGPGKRLFALTWKIAGGERILQMYRGCRRVYGNLEITWIEEEEIRKWRNTTKNNDGGKDGEPLKSIKFFEQLEEVSLN